VREHVGVSRRQRTPQEKKKLSLERDRIDIAWNNRHGQRLGRPRRKAGAERTYRHKVRLILRLDPEREPGVRRKQVSRQPGPTIKEHLEDRASKRDVLQEHPRRSEEARQRRAWRRSR
jgi:hypothetical protein